MAQPPILNLEAVTKQFSRAHLPAVAGVSLSLAQGDLLGLLGPSGCGKTTLLRLIAGFEQPQSGYISIAGQPVADLNTCVAPEHRSVGMVFQDFALFPHLTIVENVAFGLSSERRQRRVVRHQAAEAIALVGLQGMEKRYPHELSGGQQQRVALARALAPRPALILMDEPLSNLDVEVRLYLRQEVRQILKATGISGIFVTHDQEEALSISDQVAVMRHGKIEQIGTPEQIYGEPASRFVAKFVAQANFLPAQRQADGWDTELGHFHLSQTYCTCKADWEVCQTEPSVGELMVRQEDLRLTLDPSSNVVVSDRQFLGREYCYSLQTASGLKLQARTSTSVMMPVGARVKVSVADLSLCFFPTLLPVSAQPYPAALNAS